MSDTLVQENQTDHTPLKQFFGIDTPYDDGYGDDFDYITNWAKERNLSKEDMLLEIKKIEMRLGSPMPGEKRWHRVKHHLSLDAKLTSTLKEMAAHERAWGGMV